MNWKERYKKFANNNLPELFWDDKRDTREFVYFKNGEPRISTNIYNALEEITWAGFYYPYICKYVTCKKENGKYVYETKVGHNHSHDFDAVVEALYYSPESFKIEKDDEEYYSKQELEYLKRVQKYLLFLEVKDVDSYHIPVSRYRNKRQKKYEKACKHSYDNKRIDMILNGEKDYCILEWYSSFGEKKKEYKPGEYRALVTNEDGDYKLYVEYTYAEVKMFKELKEKSSKLKNDDKVIIVHLKVLERF